MGVDGVAVAATCIALGAPWAVAGSWRAPDGTLVRTARAALGGIAAAELAWAAFGLLEVAGIDVRFEWVARGDGRALVITMLIGLAEEGAKLAGAILATPPARCHPRERFRMVLAVAAVFATVEAVLVLPGATWPVVLGRAAFAPVAHALLAVPVAFAFSAVGGAASFRGGAQLAAALLASALLHAFGDWSVARPAWGRVGYAVTLLLPALWLYARDRWPLRVARYGARPRFQEARRSA